MPIHEVNVRGWQGGFRPSRGPLARFLLRQLFQTRLTHGRPTIIGFTDFFDSVDSIIHYSSSEEYAEGVRELLSKIAYACLWSSGGMR